MFTIYTSILRHGRESRQRGFIAANFHEARFMESRSGLGVENAGALLGHLVERERILRAKRLCRFARVGRIVRRFLQRVGEFLTAAIVAGVGHGLTAARLVAGRTVESHMDVVVVSTANAAVTGANATQPPCISAFRIFLLAEILLDGRRGEDACDIGSLSRVAHEIGVSRSPDFGIQIGAVNLQH